MAVREIWLRGNRRAIAMAMVPAGLAMLLGGMIVAAAMLPPRFGWLTFGVLLTVVGFAVVVALGCWWRRPAVAYEAKQLCVYVRAGGPIRVPIEYVECFFLGAAPASIPGGGEKSRVSAVVVRLAERAVEWRQHEVLGALASWCDGYITIHGTWCEPLNLKRVEQLNARLREVQNDAAPGQRA